MQNHYNDLKPIAEMMYPDPAVTNLAGGHDADMGTSITVYP